MCTNHSAIPDEGTVMEVRSTAVRHVLYVGKLQAFHGRKYYQDFFFSKTQACNNNLHAVTWQSWKLDPNPLRF